MKPSLIRRLLFCVFVFWPLATAVLFADVVLISFGEGRLPRFLFLAFLLGGICIEGLWVYYVDHSGLGQRVHDFLGLTRNPFTGQYGATRREIEERLRGKHNEDDGGS